MTLPERTGRDSVNLALRRHLVNRVKLKQPAIEGTAQLSMAGFGQDVAFSFEQSTGQREGKGMIAGHPDAMRAAFKAGYVSVIMPGGRRLRLQVIAHSEGGDTAYVQFADAAGGLLPAVGS